MFRKINRLVYHIEKNRQVFKKYLAGFKIIILIKSKLTRIINIPSVSFLLRPLWNFFRLTGIICFAITDKDTDLNLPCKVLFFICHYCMIAFISFFYGCVFVSLFVNPYYDPMEAYDIGLLIFNITGYFPMTTLLM